MYEGMFKDLLDANRGVKYFYLSTDEAYYVGLADSPACNEAARAKELGSVGRCWPSSSPKPPVCCTPRAAK